MDWWKDLIIILLNIKLFYLSKKIRKSSRRTIKCYYTNKKFYNRIWKGFYIINKWYFLKILNF